MLYSQPLQNN